LELTKFYQSAKIVVWLFICLDRSHCHH